MNHQINNNTTSYLPTYPHHATSYLHTCAHIHTHARARAYHILVGTERSEGGHEDIEPEVVLFAADKVRVVDVSADDPFVLPGVAEELLEL